MTNKAKELMKQVAVKLSTMLGEENKPTDADGTDNVGKTDDVPVTPKEYTLESGDKIKIDKLEVGGKVTTIDPNGEEAQAAAGEYALADGTYVTVGDDGCISEIESAQEEAAEGDDDDEVANEKMSAAVKAAVETALTEQKQKFAAHETSVKGELDKVKTEFEAFKKQAGEVIKGMTEAMAAYMADAADGPLDEPKNIFQEIKSESERKIQSYLESMKKIGK